MKNTKLYALLLTVFTFLSFNVYAQSEMSPRERVSLEVIQGVVIEIVQETREITLMGPEGNLVTVTAGDAVQRFNEIGVGDVISFEYLTYLMAEFRQPTPEELETPLVVMVEAGKASPEIDPAAELGAIVKAVVTVEVINRPFMSVTIRGPGGNYMTIDVDDQELLKELNIGQIVILTYAEAVAVSLDKIVDFSE